MHTIHLTDEQVAVVISDMTIAETNDMGATITHRGVHPNHGPITVVSNAAGPSLMIQDAAAEMISLLATAYWDTASIRSMPELFTSEQKAQIADHACDAIELALECCGVDHSKLSDLLLVGQEDDRLVKWESFFDPAEPPVMPSTSTVHQSSRPTREEMEGTFRLFSTPTPAQNA